MPARGSGGQRQSPPSEQGAAGGREPVTDAKPMAQLWPQNGQGTALPSSPPLPSACAVSAPVLARCSRARPARGREASALQPDKQLPARACSEWTW